MANGRMNVGQLRKVKSFGSASELNGAPMTPPKSTMPAPPMFCGELNGKVMTELSRERGVLNAKMAGAQ